MRMYNGRYFFIVIADIMSILYLYRMTDRYSFAVVWNLRRSPQCWVHRRRKFSASPEFRRHRSLSTIASAPTLSNLRVKV